MDTDIYFQEVADLSNSWNGYKREAAIKSLLLLRDPRAIPLLIKRTNDWVSSVQQLAQCTLLKFLEWYPAEFVQHLPEVFHLHNQGRWDHRNLIQSIAEKFAAIAPAELLAAVSSADNKLAFITLNLCVTYKLAPCIELIRLGIANGQLTNSRMLASLIYQLSDAELLAISDILLQINYLPFRNKAIKQLDTLVPEKIALIAKSLMTSKDNQIRMIARKHLALDETAAINFYQKLLNTTHTTPNNKIVAMIELTTLQKLAALPTLKLLLNDPAPKVRRCALQKVAELQGEQAKSIFVAALLDSQVSVVREVARLCRKNGIVFSREEILSLAAQTDRVRTLDSLILIGKLQERWSRLIIYLQLLSIYKDESVTVNHIRHAIDGWQRTVMYGSGLIPKGRLTELDGLIRANKDTLTKYQYQQLLFMLDTSR